MEKPYLMIHLKFTIERVGIRHYISRVYNYFGKMLFEKEFKGFDKETVKKLTHNKVFKQVLTVKE